MAIIKSGASSDLLTVDAVSKAARSSIYLPDGTLQGASLCVTATGAANAGVTATLPAAVGLKHYIIALDIVKFYALLGVAAAAPILVTTTNLAGSPVFSFDQSAATQGTASWRSIVPTYPIVSTTVNTPTTIVCPAQTQTIWRVSVWYFTAP